VLQPFPPSRFLLLATPFTHFRENFIKELGVNMNGMQTKPGVFIEQIQRLLE
jgi:hypothetical protein